MVGAKYKDDGVMVEGLGCEGFSFQLSWFGVSGYRTSAKSGDTTPCRMAGVALHSHVRYEEI